MGHGRFEMPSLKHLTDDDKETFDLWLAAQPAYKEAVKASEAAQVALQSVAPGQDARAFFYARRAAQVARDGAAELVEEVKKELEKRFRKETEGPLWSD